mmetsp:Transcript_4476/g.8184  ORF Transcript_4476/g.8184 Transcript_4476/m.8184 type:complete len:97 (-) Transcript_4476:541-831(-)
MVLQELPGYPQLAKTPFRFVRSCIHKRESSYSNSNSYSYTVHISFIDTRETSLDFPTPEKEFQWRLFVALTSKEPNHQIAFFPPGFKPYGRLHKFI